MKLSEAVAGDVVTVVAIADDPAGRRLGAIGFVPGTVVEVGRTAPLGDPTMYRLRGAQFAMRRSASVLVEVERAGEARP